MHLAVPAADLANYDEANGWTVEPGDYEVILGRSWSLPALPQVPERADGMTMRVWVFMSGR